MILEGENAKKNKPTEFEKDADLRISLNWTVIRDNDVSGCRFEERSSIWVYHIYYWSGFQDMTTYKKFELWQTDVLMLVYMKLQKSVDCENW